MSTNDRANFERLWDKQGTEKKDRQVEIGSNWLPSGQQQEPGPWLDRVGSEGRHPGEVEDPFARIIESEQVPPSQRKLLVDELERVKERQLTSLEAIGVRIDEQNQRLNDIRERVSELEGGEQNVTGLEDLIEKEMVPEAQPQDDTIAREVNERVVAPLLFGTGLVLLLASVGAALEGALLLAAIILPAPLLTGYFLWRFQKV